MPKNNIQALWILFKPQEGHLFMTQVYKFFIVSNTKFKFLCLDSKTYIVMQFVYTKIYSICEGY